MISFSIVMCISLAKIMAVSSGDGIIYRKGGVSDSSQSRNLDYLYLTKFFTKAIALFICGVYFSLTDLADAYGFYLLMKVTLLTLVGSNEPY
jgi:hypothetical protein